MLSCDNRKKSHCYVRNTVLSFVPTTAIPCPTVSTAQGLQVLTLYTGPLGLPLLWWHNCFLCKSRTVNALDEELGYFWWQDNRDEFRSSKEQTECVCVGTEWKIEGEPVELWSIPRFLWLFFWWDQHFSFFWESISICVLIAFEISTKTFQGKGQ